MRSRISRLLIIFSPTFHKCPLDNNWVIPYNDMVIGVWRSLVSRLVRVQEASGSNPDTPTKKAVEATASAAFFIGMAEEPEASWMSSLRGSCEARSEWGHNASSRACPASGSNPDTPTKIKGLLRQPFYFGLRSGFERPTPVRTLV